MRVLYYLITLIVLFFGSTVHANLNNNDLTDFNDLSDVQKAEIFTSIAKFKTETERQGRNIKSNIPEVTIENIERYSDIGKNIGSGIAAAAHEVGLAAGDFSKTPLGFATFFVIFWHFIGESISSLFLSIFWLIIVIPIWIKMFYNTCFTLVTHTRRDANNNNEVVILTKTQNVKHWFKPNETIEVPVRKLDTDKSVFMTIILFCLLGIMFLF